MFLRVWAIIPWLEFSITIFELNVFTLDKLNAGIKEFEESNNDIISNKIPLIKKEHIKDRKKLKVSAAEMLSLLRFFGIIVADKVTDFVGSESFVSDNSLGDGDKMNISDSDSFEKQKVIQIWNLYCNLRKIVGLLTSPRYHSGNLKQLESLIPRFLESYKDLYGELVYKFHNLIHVIRGLLKNGPMIHFQTARYESKHRPQKQAAASSSCKKMLLKPFACEINCK